MSISARNQIKGTVVSIQEGAINAIVHVKTSTNECICSTISLDAVKELGLDVGKEVAAVVKATEVMIGTGDTKLSARNQFAGEIENLQEGMVNTIVTLKTEGGTVFTATISNEAVKELALTAGANAKAIFKATSVMIAA